MEIQQFIVLNSLSPQQYTPINNKKNRMQKKQEKTEHECLQNYSSLIDNGLSSLIISQPEPSKHFDNLTQSFMSRTYSQNSSSPLRTKFDSPSKKNTLENNKTIHHHENDGHQSYEAIEGVEPWTQKNFQITEYHKKKHTENQQKKARNSRKVTCVGLKQPKIKDCLQFQDSRAVTLSSKWQQRQKQCSHRICSSRKEKQYKSETNFHTISTSAQQKIKWQLQMEIMMRRRKKVSNMLKIRHFGHLKINTQIYKPSNNSNKSSCKKQDWINSLQIQNVEESIRQYQPQPKQNSPTNCQAAQKSQTGSSHKKQIAKIEVQNLYSVLKSFMHRNQVKRRMSQTKTHKPRQNSASSSSSYRMNYGTAGFQKKTSLQYKTLPQEEPEVKFINYSKVQQISHTSEDLKNRFSQILSNRESRLNKNNDNRVMYNSFQAQKIHTRSENLTKQNYSRHSIKNRLKLLKSRAKVQKNSVQAPKSAKQKVQQISSLTRVNPPKNKI